MSDVRAVDCQGLAGAWSLGTVQAGWDLTHRVALPGGFGNEPFDANRELLEFDGRIETGDSDEWTVQRAGLVHGTPPCSAFSSTTIGMAFHGPDSAINDCMKSLVKYASRCTGEDGRAGPEFVAFESVQNAARSGRELMRELCQRLRRQTGQDYTLTHVLMSGATVGAAQLRRRYYFVAHRVPFGIEVDYPWQTVTAGMALEDLQGLRDSWDAQPYVSPATHGFGRAHRSDTGLVDSHASKPPPKPGTRAAEEWELLQVWPLGLKWEEYLRQLLEAGALPGPERYFKEDGTVKGLHWTFPHRLDPDKPGPVVTGGGISHLFHWAENRSLSVRELARLMGYPDDWSWGVANTAEQASAWVGKCCPVESGRWISRWMLRSLRGEPGAQTGEPTEVEWEREINVTNEWKLKEQAGTITQTKEAR